MNKISSIIKLMFVLILFSTLTFAQYDKDTKKDKSDRQGTQTNQSNHGTQNDSDDNLLGTNDNDPFKQTAMTLAQDLQSRLTLSNDQVEKITDILVDYKDEVADIKKDKADEMRDAAEKGTTKTETDRTETSKNDTARVGENNEMLGGRTDFEEKFREADVNANEDIEDALEEGQLAKYIQIKRDWWDSVKERVHSAAAEKNQRENKDNDKGIMDTDNDNDNN